MSITKKSTLAFAVAFLMMAALWLVGMSTPVHAEDGDGYARDNGIFYELDEEANTVIAYRDIDDPNEITSANIKDKVTIGGKTYSVTGIDFGGFSECPSLTSVTIPSSITIIGEDAFVNTGLKEIKIPSSVKTIGDHAVGFNYDYDEDVFMPVAGFTIYGTTGSEAENYAKRFNIKFVDKDAEAKKAAEEAAAKKAAAIKEAKALKTKTKAKALKNHKATVSWKKVSKANGYEIYRANKKAGKYKKIKTIKKAKTVKFTDKKLKKGKKYFYKVRTYKTVDGKKVYGKWSSVAKIKAK